jgi:hypothetical protein
VRTWLHSSRFQTRFSATSGCNSSRPLLESAFLGICKSCKRLVFLSCRQGSNTYFMKLWGWIRQNYVLVESCCLQG